MATNGITITETAFKGACGALFGLAIIAAIARTSIRFRTSQKYALDDFLLLLACICLTAATGLLYNLVPLAYLWEELDFHEIVSLPFSISDLSKETVYTIRLLHTYTLTSWLVVFAAKFCFLSFFRALIDRVRRMIIYWRIVVLVTIVFGGLSLCETFIACPHIEASSIQCLQGPGFKRTLVTGVVAKCLDIITDVLLITIPISLLWNVRIKTRQKLGIGAFLCLSIVMVIVAIIKASGIRTSADSFNLVWELFWQQVEACAAVIMVSFTAFRSIFLSNKQRVEKKVVRPGILDQFHAWLSSKKVSRGDAKESPSAQVDQAPPQVTLGTPFRSIQRKGLLGSQVQPMSQSLPSSHGQDGRNPEDFVTQPQSIDLSGITDSRSSEHHPGKDPLSFGSSHHKHWWQAGIISNFTLSRSNGADSEV